MNRTTLSLAGTVVALAVVTGAAVLTAPQAGRADTPAPAARKPVERSTLACPAPTSSDYGSTTYTVFTPETGTEGASRRGTAQLAPAAQGGDGGDEGARGTPEAFVELLKPGNPVVKESSKADTPALVGTADGILAPGFSAQLTTVVDAGPGRGLLGTACQAPDTEFWFPGVSTGKDRQDYVHLTNPDDDAAVVDLELYDAKGLLETPAGDNITVPARSTTAVLLSTLTGDPTQNLTLHAVARSGRIGAAVQAADRELGSDWLPASADPAATAMLPGIPKDAGAVRLVLHATGREDVDLALRVSTPSGTITPAGHESVRVRGGTTTAVDLGDIAQDEVGSLMLRPTEKGATAPFTASIRVVRGAGDRQESAFVAAADPVGGRAVSPDNRREGSALFLTAPEKGAKVRITSSPVGGGKAVSETVTVKGGTTLDTPLPQPSSGKGAFAVTLEPVSGGPVYAVRMLAPPSNSIQRFTLQTLSDDRGTVSVPRAEQDLSVLTAG
ncbi:DUF5719 family protein [Streptomyces thermolineatus]|uniref:DUF5719 family protein n=2 Tax=Streptomyces TaxID=1883 RepID=UPI003850BF95